MSQFIHGLQAISSYVGDLQSRRGHIVVFGRSECSWTEKGLRRLESVSVPPSHRLEDAKSSHRDANSKTLFSEGHDRLS